MYLLFLCNYFAYISLGLVCFSLKQVSDKYSILPWNLTLVSKWLTGSQSNIHFSFAFALFTVFPGNLWPTLKFSSPEVIFALNNFVESLFTVLSVHTVDQVPSRGCFSVYVISSLFAIQFGSRLLYSSLFMFVIIYLYSSAPILLRWLSTF